jgi:uncharacterized repeat protein (TIGR01451 family)
VRQIELRLQALAGELEECREALRAAVARYDRDRLKQQARRRRLVLALSLVAVFVAGLTAADTPSFGAPARVHDPCGPAAASITDASFTFGNGTITATFTVRPGCAGTTVTLASYEVFTDLQRLYPQTLFDRQTRTLGAGRQTLTVTLPSCFWQVDLMTGLPPMHLDAPPPNHGTTVLGAKGGHTPCQPVTTTTTTTVHTTTTTPTTTTAPTTTTHETTTAPTTTTTTPSTTISTTTHETTTPGTTTTSPPSTAPVVPPPGAASTDIAVTKVSDRPSAIVGQQVTYTLTVVNNGPSDALDVVLVDTLPSQESFVSVSDAVCTGTTIITCNFGTIAAGASRSVTVVTLASSPGTATNTATVTTTTPETNTTNNQAQATVPITGPFKPPAARCAVLSLSHGTLVAGRRTSVGVVARVNGAPAGGVQVELSGPGIRLVTTTSASGRASFSVTPHGTGVLRVHVIQAQSCPQTVSELSVPGAFRPPKLTG